MTCKHQIYKKISHINKLFEPYVALLGVFINVYIYADQ